MNEEFYQKVSAELDRAASGDEMLSILLEKIQSGEADFQDTQKYSQKFSELIGNVLFQNVAAVADAGSKEFACLMMLQDYHQNINEILSIVQKSLDQKANIQIKPQKAAFPLERVKQAAHALEDKRVPIETIQRRAEQAVANIANSFHDDYIQENAKFRSNAGLKCDITRTTTGKCCAWCSQIAGRYEYGKHLADVFRRHDNCDCVVVYGNGKQRQNVWTKKSWSAPDISAEALNFKPTVLTREQAAQTEWENLQYKGLTIPGKTDIMKTGGKITDKNFMFAERFESQAKKFYEARIKSGDEDIKRIAMHTGFSYEDIQAIKNHVMVEEHLFADGTVRKFDANIDQALAWQRLMEGEGKDSDILLLNHELRELRYMQETGCDYETAHNYSCQKYDWQSVIDNIIDTDTLKSYLME